jgi:hypothetical protein
VEITEQDLAALRAKLGLSDDAEFGDVLDALDEAGREQEKEPVAAKLPDGVVPVDRATWEQVQADAKLGREAALAQAQARREGVVQAAIEAGKIMPGRRDHWLTQIAQDEAGITAAIDSLAPVFGTSELGHDDGREARPATTLAEIREDPTYRNWKVV